jgi:hypothetical protein
MTTIYAISEQILRQFYGGVPSDDARVSINEVKLLVNQTATNKLKAQFYERLQMDDYSVPACMIATYPNLPVETDDVTGSVYTKLPAQPISLPLDMGVYEVYDSKNMSNDILPLRSGQFRLLGPEVIKRQNWYIVEADRITFSDSVMNSQIKKVNMKLLLHNFSKLSDYDQYPVPPEIEAEIIVEVLNILRQRNPNQDTNNNSVDESNNG